VNRLVEMEKPRYLIHDQGMEVWATSRVPLCYILAREIVSSHAQNRSGR
jgi:hypothetical protein